MLIFDVKSRLILAKLQLAILNIKFILKINAISYQQMLITILKK